MLNLAHLIDRLEAIEERLGIELSAISATLDDDMDIIVCGEISTINGCELAQSIDICAAVYNSAGLVVGTNNVSIFSNDFMGFETFKIIVFNMNDVKKIRVYVKKR